MKEIIENITKNNDNLGILNIVNILLNIVINNIENINDMDNDYMNDYDLGNDKYIKKDDLESLVSITDTINDIKHYNRNDKTNIMTDDKIWLAFTTFFREVKGYEDWTDEEIGGSMNNDDINEFIEYLKVSLGYEVK